MKTPIMKSWATGEWGQYLRLKHKKGEMSMVTPYIVFNGNCKEDTYALGVKSRDKSGGRYLDGMKQKEGDLKWNFKL